MKKLCGTGLGSLMTRGLFILLFFIPAVFSPADSQAFPFFSRQVGRDCAFCHTLIPRLNEKGRTFRSNGYRFEGEGEWKEAVDLTDIPASLEAEVEGAYSRVKNSSWAASSNIVIEEAELSTGGAMGKSGSVSVLASILAAGKAAGSGADVSAPRAFIQLNDIAGPRGRGALNLRAGEWDIGLPFFNAVGEVITDKLLSETVLNVLTLQQKAVELNGSVVAEEDSNYPTHRYSVGAAGEDVNSGNKLKGYYAIYSATFREFFNLGAIYRGGEEKTGATDSRYNKYGVALESDTGPLLVTIGYFRKELENAKGLNNCVAEAVFKPFSRVSFAARYDIVKVNGMKEAKAGSLMARYNILSNVFAQLELRGLSDRDHIKGANSDEEKIRLFLTAIF